MTKTTVKLPEKLDISTVTSLKGRLDKALEKDAATIEINAQEVATVDSAAIQLLLSFQKQAHSQGKEVQIVKASEMMVSGNELLGASDLLPLEQ